MLDYYYPIIESLKEESMASMAYLMKLRTHLDRARKGSKEAESRLVNRIGQLRRTFPEEIPVWAREEVKNAVVFLRSTGRTINLSAEDPSIWITRRDGKPRW